MLERLTRIPTKGGEISAIRCTKQASENLTAVEKLSMQNGHFQFSRTPQKKETLKRILHHINPRVFVATETRLMTYECDSSVIPGYAVVAKTGTSKHRRGVTIFTQVGVGAQKVENEGT